MRANPAQHNGDCPAGLRPNAALDALDGVAQRVIARLRLWRRRLSQRHELSQLARLDDRMLKDIGLTRSDAEFLINRPFWRE